MKQLPKFSLRSGVLADHATQRLKRLKACSTCGKQFLAYQSYNYCSPCSWRPQIVQKEVKHGT